MRTRFQSYRDRSSMDSMMTPMIDVVFLLLIFFLTTASFEVIEQLLPSGISDQGTVAAGQADKAPPPELAKDVNDCIVKILAKPGNQLDFVYQLNGADIAFEMLAQRLQAIIAVRSDIPIIVDPDDRVPIFRAIEIYDLARSHGGSQVYFAVR